MTLSIRRVVTDHDAQGQSVVSYDEITSNIVSRRPGHSSSVIWSHAQTPVDNQEAGDAGLRNVADCAADGAIFRVVEYGPGVSPRMHRTQTVDYAVVMAGEIYMVLDGGHEVHLKAGDVLVQRGTVHDWINRGTVPCVIAFVLIAAKAPVINGKELGPIG
jgi:mannose-6-phosphate isomerase-like protein (cupin superfamily)